MKRRLMTMVVGGATAAIALVLSGCASIQGGCPHNYGPDCNPACACPAVKKKAAPAPSTKPASRKPGPVVSGLRDIPTISQNGDNMVGTLFLPTGEPSTSFLMVQRQTPAEVSLGEPFTYSILVKNLTTGDVDNVKVVERNSSGLEVVGSQPQGRMGGDGSLTWALGTLKGGETKEIKVLAKATVLGEHRHCVIVTYDPKVCLTVVATQAKLLLDKTAPSEAILCDPIPVNLVVTNPGSGVAKAVKITDTLPDGLVTQDNKRTVTIDVGDLAPGASREFTYMAKAQRTGTYKAPARAVAVGGLEATDETTTVVRQAVLKIAKSGTARALVGRPVKYEVKISNDGDAAATQLVVQDTLPVGVRFESASDGGMFANGVITWSLGGLAAGAGKTLTVNTTAIQIGNWQNQAKATATCAKAVQAVAATKIEGIPAILLEVIDLEDPLEVGGNETYVITATNQGSAAGTNISITVELEDTQAYVSAGGATNPTATGQTIKLAPLPTLAPKAKAVWRVVTKAVKAGDVRFKVIMTSDQIGRPVQETEATNQY